MQPRRSVDSVSDPYLLLTPVAGSAAAPKWVSMCRPQNCGRNTGLGGHTRGGGAVWPGGWGRSDGAASRGAPGETRQEGPRPPAPEPRNPALPAPRFGRRQVCGRLCLPPQKSGFNALGSVCYLSPCCPGPEASGLCDTGLSRREGRRSSGHVGDGERDEHEVAEGSDRNAPGAGGSGPGGVDGRPLSLHLRPAGLSPRLPARGPKTDRFPARRPQSRLGLSGAVRDAPRRPPRSELKARGST